MGPDPGLGGAGVAAPPQGSIAGCELLDPGLEALPVGSSVVRCRSQGRWCHRSLLALRAERPSCSRRRDPWLWCQYGRLLRNVHGCCHICALPARREGRKSLAYPSPGMGFVAWHASCTGGSALGLTPPSGRSKSARFDRPAFCLPPFLASRLLWARLCPHLLPCPRSARRPRGIVIGRTA